MNARRWARKHRLPLALGAGFVAAHAAAYTFFASHNPYREALFPPCILLHYVGIQCPGCGGTRAMFSLLHGDVAASIAMNPIVLAGYLALALLLGGVALGRASKPGFARMLYWAAGSVTAGALVWSAVLRNLIA